MVDSRSTIYYSKTELYISSRGILFHLLFDLLMQSHSSITDKYVVNLFKIKIDMKMMMSIVSTLLSLFLTFIFICNMDIWIIHPILCCYDLIMIGILWLYLWLHRLSCELFIIILLIFFEICLLRNLIFLCSSIFRRGYLLFLHRMHLLSYNISA